MIGNFTIPVSNPSQRLIATQVFEEIYYLCIFCTQIIQTMHIFFKEKKNKKQKTTNSQPTQTSPKLIYKVGLTILEHVGCSTKILEHFHFDCSKVGFAAQRREKD
jgi:hypothetical protein